MIFHFLLLTMIIGLSVKYAVIRFALPSWTYYVFLPVLAFVFYVANSVLIRHYIAKRAPEFASNEESASGIQKWELTAGLGIVPKWVSYIGFASISSLFALILPFLLHALGNA